jgi:long-chain acyl-CoA synthetase
MWETFINRLENEMKRGKKFDLSFIKSWVVGGEGTDISKYKEWNETLRRCGSNIGVASGYGTSELFASTCAEKLDTRVPLDKKVMGVGIPILGLTAGVFDKNGNELKYNTRGELWIKGNSIMKGYYNKPELTKKTKVDGWIHTGDLAEIDENGFVYVWGRVTDTLQLQSGRSIFLFDIANRIKDKNYISDAIVLPAPAGNGKADVVAHIVWNKNVNEKETISYIEELNEYIRSFDPEINVCAYAVYDVMLPYSPTTLKKDKNKMSKRMDGFVQVIDGQLVNIDFHDIESGRFVMKNAG